MPTTSTTKLVARAKAAADMHDRFVTDEEWMDWASQERMALDLFIARSGWVQAFETITITVNGTENGAFTPQLGADDASILAIVSVHHVTSQGVRLLTLQDPTSFLHVLPGGTQRGSATTFRAKRSDDTLILNLYPEPTTGETYLVTYIPHPRPLALTTTTGYDTSVSYPMGWEERIVLGMARRALDKEESDPTPVLRQLLECESRIEQLCSNRAGGMSILNSDLVNYGWTDRLSYPPAINWWWA